MFIRRLVLFNFKIGWKDSIVSSLLFNAKDALKRQHNTFKVMVELYVYTIFGAVVAVEVDMYNNKTLRDHNWVHFAHRL